VPKSTQPSIRRETIEWVLAFGLSITVNGDDFGLQAEVGWWLAAAWRCFTFVKWTVRTLYHYYKSIVIIAPDNNASTYISRPSSCSKWIRLCNSRGRGGTMLVVVDPQLNDLHLWIIHIRDVECWCCWRRREAAGLLRVLTSGIRNTKELWLMIEPLTMLVSTATDWRCSARSAATYEATCVSRSATGRAAVVLWCGGIRICRISGLISVRDSVNRYMCLHMHMSRNISRKSHRWCVCCPHDACVTRRTKPSQANTTRTSDLSIVFLKSLDGLDGNMDSLCPFVCASGGLFEIPVHCLVSSWYLFLGLRVCGCILPGII